MHCPYPNCDSHSSSAAHPIDPDLRHVADEVFLCGHCWKLAYQCVARNCTELNRPFSYFCRKCGKCQFLQSEGFTADRRWYLAKQFDYSWRFRTSRSEEGRDSALLGDPATIILDDVSYGDSSPDSGQQGDDKHILLGCSFLDGLIAVHHGHEFMCLVHPFSDLAEGRQNPPVWFEREGRILQRAGRRAPQCDRTPDWFRPYTPLLTPDRRYALFSTPYACTALDMWTLPDWSSAQEPRTELLIAFDEKSQVRLAAPPIPLTEQNWPHNQSTAGETTFRPEPDLLGLLLRTDDQAYLWCVVEINAFFEGDGAEVRSRLQTAIQSQINPGQIQSDTEESVAPVPDLPVCVPLPLTGPAVQVEFLRVRNKIEKIIFCTAQGHWIWSTADAGRVGRSPEPRDLSGDDGFGGSQQQSAIEDRLLHLPEQQGVAAELNRQNEDRKNFSWLRRCIFTSNPMSAGTFQIAYVADHAAHVRTVKSETFERNGNTTTPAKALAGCEGLFASATSGQGDNELLFVSGKDGAIYRRLPTINEPLKLENGHIGQITDICGMQFEDPLLLLIRRDPTSVDGYTFEVELRNVRHPTSEQPGLQLTGDVSVGGLKLQADPLAWSNFLFTCELNDTGVVIRRHEFTVFSDETNPHMNERQSLG